MKPVNAADWSCYGLCPARNQVSSPTRPVKDPDLEQLYVMAVNKRIIAHEIGVKIDRTGDTESFSSEPTPLCFTLLGLPSRFG